MRVAPKKIFLFSSFFAIFVFYTLSLFSCATTLTVQAQRPAKVDVGGARSVAVLPFKPQGYSSEGDVYGVVIAINSFFSALEGHSPEERACLNYMKSSLEDRISRKGYYDLVSSSAVEGAVKNSKANPADIYITGESVYFKVDDSRQKKVIKVRNEDTDGEEGKEETKYIEKYEYGREVRFRFRYQIVDGATSKVIYSDNYDFYTSESNYESAWDLPSPFKMLEYRLNGAVNDIIKNIQPYTVYKSLKLLEVRKNNAMKDAQKLAKDGNLRQALELYDEIYSYSGLFEAGYNAALLQEALGDLQDAKIRMENLRNETRRSEASTALIEIENEIYQAEKFRQNEEKRGLNK